MDQLDQQAVTLAKAIRQTESGGNFQARGKSGEIGAYQFTPNTWKNYSSQYGINTPLEQATPQQQNEVAYKKIKEWKDKGYNVGQISSMWNAGDGEPEAYKGTFSNGQPSVRKGVPGKVDFSVPDYAHSVATTYQQFKMGNTNPIITPNPSSVEQPTGLGGTKPGDKLGEMVIDNSATRYVANNLPSASTVGNFLGGAANYITRGFTDLAAIPVQAGVAGYNVLTGSDVKDPFRNGIPALGGKTATVNPISDVKGKLGSAVEVAGTTGAVAGAGGAYKGATGSILKSPTFKTVVTDDLGMNYDKFMKLGKLEQSKALLDATGHWGKDLSPGSKMVIEKAVESLSADKAGLIKKALSIATGNRVGLLDLLGMKEGVSLIKSLFK